MKNYLNNGDYLIYYHKSLTMKTNSSQNEVNGLDFWTLGCSSDEETIL